MKTIHNNDIFIALTEVAGIAWTIVAWFSGAHIAWVIITICFNIVCVYLLLSKYRNNTFNTRAVA